MALMCCCCFLIKSIIAKQFEGSRIKRMCIFHVLTVRGLPGSEGASASCMGLPGNTEAPYTTRLISLLYLMCAPYPYNDDIVFIIYYYYYYICCSVLFLLL